MHLFLCCVTAVATASEDRQSARMLYEQTVAPQVSANTEVRWIAFLLHMLDSRSPYREYAWQPHSNSIGVLLEIASHDEANVKAASRQFSRANTYWDALGRRDGLTLVMNVMLNAPNGNPGMWPLAVGNGRIYFAGRWPDFSDVTKLEINPFVATYEQNKKQWGRRDLAPFERQRLTPAERAQLWAQFQNPKLRRSGSRGL